MARAELEEFIAQSVDRPLAVDWGLSIDKSNKVLVVTVDGVEVLRMSASQALLNLGVDAIHEQFINGTIAEIVLRKQQR